MRADKITTRASLRTQRDGADYRRSVSLLLFSAALAACGPKAADNSTSMTADSAVAARSATGGAMAGGSAAGAMPSKPTSGMAMGSLDTSAKNVGMTGLDHSKMAGCPATRTRCFST